MEDTSRIRGLTVFAAVAAIYAVTLLAPPHLMDDVDSVQATIARNMLWSGDWVTASLDGIPYLEKSPLGYWLAAISYSVFGVHDWAARLPIVLGIFGLIAVTMAFARWAFGRVTAAYAGLALGTCIGLFLFTRILIPDVLLTATITLALFSFLRALDPEEPHPARWSAIMGAAIGAGLLLKGLIAAVFPGAAMFLFLVFTRQILVRETWRRLRPVRSVAIILLVAAPWHILATLRNPPALDFTMKSEPGQYRGFFWFYFFNEHILRFLNLRYPRDYNTVPRHLFWLFHLLWFFPWSFALPGVVKLRYGGSTRAGRARLLCLCWTLFILVFFTFSTTQEYYSLPAYPAFAILIACVLADPPRWLAGFRKAVGVVAALAAAAVVFLLVKTWGLPADGDISRALAQNPDLYTLSLGHMGDLTIASFAYLRLPLAIAGLAFLTGAFAALFFNGRRAILGIALMMILFLNAARVAMISFDPYLSSQPLAAALRAAPPGDVIFDNQYYAFSSVVFYAKLHRVWLLNGRVNNLEYGSNAPGAPNVFLTDAELPQRWNSPQRYYLLVEKPSVPRIRQVLGNSALHTVKESGGKFLFTNRAL